MDPGSAILFMKVGIHANESLEDIISRKTEEIDRSGYAMWGYGGNTCHPLTIVRPFASACEEAHQTIKLVMEEIDSKHFAEQIAADEYSINGLEWQKIDKDVHKVLGSRYALFINNLHTEEFDLPLVHSRVAIGPSEGRRADIYIQGRVDKACLIYSPQESLAAPMPAPKRIKLCADIVAPYAALLRNN